MNTAILLLAVISSTFTFAMAEPIRIATSADSYPYNFGSADGCTSASGVCGFEVDLFDAICKEMNVTCTWSINPWATIFDNLLNPDANGKYAYDAIVASTEASPQRRMLMLFSYSYFTAKHLFVGHANLAVEFDSNGYYPKDGQNLVIGTWSGYMQDALTAVYAGSKTIKVVAVDDPILSLQKGEIDLAFVFTGIERRLLTDPAYAQKGHFIPTDEADPFGGTAAASRISTSGRAIEQTFSQGLVQIRQKGIYQQISQKWMGDDIWNCKLGPQIDDPLCKQR